MTLLLVRHGSAGDREQWSGDDRLRPLDERGRRQAEGLVELLAEFEVTRVVSSPYVRCVETVRPLAAARGLAVEEREELAEGAGDAAVRFIASLRPGAVACTHGDVVEAAVGAGQPKKKGSVWVLEVAGGRINPVRYLPPPA